MAIDPSIALGFRPPEQPSQINMLAQALQLQGLQRQNQMGALDMKDREAAAAERNALRNYLAGGADLNTPEGQAGALRVAPNAASPMIKGNLEIGKLRGEIGKTEAQTAEAKARTAAEEFKNRQALVTQNLQVLGSINSPEQAARWIQGGLKSGMLDMQRASEASAEMQKAAAAGPQGFAQWKQQQMQAGMTIAQQMEQQSRQQKFGLESANELMTPDGKGGYVVNQPLLSAKSQVAKAGASNVSVNTGQKGYENESKLRNDFKSEPIYKDFQDMRSAHAQISVAVNQGTPIADTAAATKIMKLLDPGSVVRESELGIAMAAAGKMDRLTNYVQMQISGNKLTPQQRKDFGALADELMAAATQAYNTKRSEYEQFGKGYGLNPAVLGPSAPPVKRDSIMKGSGPQPTTNPDVDAALKLYGN